MAELRGISGTIGLPIGDLLLINLMYELVDDAFACTSIVGRSRPHFRLESEWMLTSPIEAENKRGEVFLARNLDYPYTQTLREFSILVNMQRNGSTVYSFVTEPGYLGEQRNDSRLLPDLVMSIR